MSPAAPAVPFCETSGANRWRPAQTPYKIQAVDTTASTTTCGQVRAGSPLLAETMARTGVFPLRLRARVGISTHLRIMMRQFVLDHLAKRRLVAGHYGVSRGEDR